MDDAIKALKERFDALMPWEKKQFFSEVFKAEENKTLIDEDLALEVLKKNDFDFSDSDLLEGCDAETLLEYCDDEDLLDEVERRDLSNDLLERLQR